MELLFQKASTRYLCHFEDIFRINLYRYDVPRIPPSHVHVRTERAGYIRYETTIWLESSFSTTLYVPPLT